MLKPTQYSLDLFKKARRMKRYTSAYIEQWLVEHDGVNDTDAATIVAVAKQLGILEAEHGNLTNVFTTAWCMAGFTADCIALRLTEKFGVGSEISEHIALLSLQLQALDFDQSNTNPVDSMAGYS